MKIFKNIQTHYKKYYIRSARLIKTIIHNANSNREFQLKNIGVHTVASTAVLSSHCVDKSSSDTPILYFLKNES